MPQMAPMNWFMLFSSFVLIFISCINKIFYINMNNFNNNKSNNLHSSLNLNMWKW